MHRINRILRHFHKVHRKLTRLLEENNQEHDATSVSVRRLEDRRKELNLEYQHARKLRDKVAEFLPEETTNASN